jgi:hypothetical protein
MTQRDRVERRRPGSELRYVFDSDASLSSDRVGRGSLFVIHATAAREKTQRLRDGVAIPVCVLPTGRGVRQVKVGWRGPTHLAELSRL